MCFPGKVSVLTLWPNWRIRDFNDLYIVISLIILGIGIGIINIFMNRPQYGDARHLPTFSHNILDRDRVPQLKDTDLLATKLERNLGKKLRDINFEFCRKTSDYNNITAKYLREFKDHTMVFGSQPRAQKIDREMVSWVREQDLNVPDNYRATLYLSAIRSGR